eukprot:2167171-Alexandrium_andersonii.AAC.1
MQNAHVLSNKPTKSSRKLEDTGAINIVLATLAYVWGVVFPALQSLALFVYRGLVSTRAGGEVGVG